MESLELLILQQLIYNPEFYRRVIPFVTPEMFRDKGCQTIAKAISYAYNHHKEEITPELLSHAVSNWEKLSAEDYQKTITAYNKVTEKPEHPQPIETLIEQTQKYFRARLVDSALAKAVVEFGDGKHEITGGTLKELSDATNFSFDQTGYYNYMGEFEHRLVEYEEKTKKYEFPLTALNRVTNGGMNSKSLSIVMASTGGGKSIFLCNAATHLIKKGFNVLYITCEMSVKEISKRIDANLTGCTQDSITNLRETGGAKHLRGQMDHKQPERFGWGQLYIKEYPAGYASSGMIGRDIEEIQRSFDVKIDVLVVDYINLLSTSRYSTKNANTYTLVKAIAEELRGIGQTFDIPVLSATQSNRSALNKETMLDAGLTAVSDSFGLPQTADFMFNIIAPEEWKKDHFRLFRILKNRWGDPSKEYIKVMLKTDVARFSDVAGFENPIEDKPTELVKNVDDKTGKIKNSTDKSDKEAAIEAQAGIPAAAEKSAGDWLFD